MANIKWSAFTSGTTITGSDITVGLQSGANVQWTMTQLKTWTSASPTLVTPTLGVATATSINKVALTAPATGSTLTIADGKTLTANNSLTLAGTDSTTMTFPSTSATIARTDAANTFTGAQTISGGTVNGTVLDISQTWGGTGTYTGIKYNVTDSGPANAASLLMDLQVGNATKLKIKKDGTIAGDATGAATLSLTDAAGSILKFDSWDFVVPGQQMYFRQSGAAGVALNVATGAITLGVSGTQAILTPTAPATLQHGAADTTLTTAPTAQTLQVQSWASSTSPNQAGANFTIAGSAGTGSGAGGSIIFQVAPATGAGGTTKNPYATALTIDSTKAATFTGPVLGPAAFPVGGASCTVLFGVNTSAGNDVASISNAGAIQMRSAGSIGWTDQVYSNTTPDTKLARDAANTLGLRITGTTASVFNVYREADSGLTATSYATIDAGKTTANTLILGSMKVGSPANALTKLQINVDGTNKLDYGVTASNVWTFGASVIAPAGGFFQFSGRTYFESNADGNLVFKNNAGSDFGRLQLGGTTSSFPALKRNGASLDLRLADDSGYANLAVQGLTCSQGVAIGSSHTVGWNSNGSYLFGNATTGANTGTMRLVASGGTSCLNFGGDTSSFPSLKRSSTALHARLADDSAYAPFSAELVTVAAGTATPAGGSTAGRLLMGTTAGFGVYYGSGAPTVSAAQGSIYLRSDGSSTSTRLYVNTDGSTTWTAVTTAA